MADKIIFLDRDGVINVLLPGDYVKTIDALEIYPEAFDAIRLLNAAGYRTVIVTNQRGIARGLMTVDDLEKVHDYLRAEMTRHGATLDAIFFCPHDYNQCECRKPKIGLFLAAEKVFDVDKDASYMIGDSASDVEAGRNYGVQTISINNPKAGADHDCADILAAARFIVDSTRNTQERINPECS